MASQRKNLAAFTIIIGVITLILTAFAFAEKAHEDHLPERNGRGNAETTVSTGVSAGILILLSVVFGFASNRNRHRSNTGNTANFRHSYRPVMASLFPMRWQMRWQFFATPVIF
jgi:formate hydrogenlyase subunit 3/multisubunit Na+/H+ antiporter MnhD subunit